MARVIRTAVVGVGHFGRHHAEKYASLRQADLVAVCDTDRARADEVAAEHGVLAVSDPRDLLGEVDAVSIAVPTHAHHEVCKTFLEADVPVLVEKPITHDLRTADDLIRIARERRVLLQVGHLERFSAAARALESLVTRPLYIECSRIAPFRVRGTDISVILDLMIHDIDLILALVPAPVVSVEAVGAPVLTGAEDIANTRLRFANGCIANITASRISTRSERKLRIFQPDSYVSVDFVSRKVVVVRKGDGEPVAGLPGFNVARQEFREDDSLEREIAAFLDCVAKGSAPLVGGEEGRRALDTAVNITESLRRHLEFVRGGYDEPALSPAAAKPPRVRAG